jgi:hypothetical protein
MENPSTKKKELPHEEAGAILERINQLNSTLQLKIKLSGSFGHKADFYQEDDIRSLIKEIADLNERLYQKVGEQLGTNEGGWYENQATREKFYLKFYKNPDQGKVEYIANAIYKKLGIKAAESFLLHVGDRLAVASKEIAGGGATIGEEEQSQNRDIRSGFIADAYLANWDVVGLVFDNIIKDANGDPWRIDNGGSLTFRAQGGTKDFSPNDIPELKNMLNPDFSAGQVFGGLTDEEQKTQADYLVMNLSEKDIDTIVDNSELDAKQAKNIKNSLIGRRQFLIKKFNIQAKPSERVVKAIERLNEQKESKETGLRSRIGILADTDKIENQEIDIIDARDVGRYEVNFKLTEAYWKTLVMKLQKEEKPGQYFDGIYYTHALNNDVKKEEDDDEYSGAIFMANAAVISANGVTVRISTDMEKRSFLGLVHIEIADKGGEFGLQEISEKVNTIFEEILEIQKGLIVPPEDAEKNYKKARYSWHHRTEPDDTPENIDSKLERKEVFPGYFTFVEPGKHKEYQSLSPYAVYHELNNLRSAPKIFKAGGLLSSHERYRRGLLYDGNSTDMDLESGGGDSVFTRTVTQDGLKDDGFGEKSTFYGAGNGAILFHPRIFDRTDWYAYNSDNYGTTEGWIFDDRQSPELLFSDQKTRGYDSCNEQMFRLGISSDDFLAIVCYEESQMLQMARLLKADGIETIQNRPVSEKIVLTKTYGELLRVSAGEEGVTLAKLLKENPEKMLEAEWRSVVQITDMIGGWVDMWNSFGGRIEESNGDFSQGTPDEFDIRYFLEEIAVFSERDFCDYMKFRFYEEMSPDDMPKKIRSNLMDKLSVLPTVLTNFIESLRKKKNILSLSEHLDEYETQVSEIKTGIARILESLKESENKNHDE